MPIITNIMKIFKYQEAIILIVYTPLWETMRRKGVTTYTLREKYKISGSTVQRLKKNMSVSTNTLDDLCRLLDCPLSEIAEYRRKS
jgi:DNA-binding Xre family transcriptional regulator